MNNVSSAWNRALLNDNRDYIEEVTILLADNSTVLQISNANIWGGGFTIEDAVSEESNFQIGAAIINKFTLVLNNLYDEYNDYVFEDAVLTVRVGLVTEESTEMIQKGRYIVNSAKYNGSLITLECYDFMSKFDKPYDDSFAVTYPATLDTIVRRACSLCGVTLATTDFPHKSYTVTERPESETTTCREVISWVAQIAGCFARMNSLGYLELKWYNQSDLESVMDGLDGGEFDSSTPYSTGDAADGGTFNPWNTGYVYDGGTFTWTNKTHLISSIYSEDISVDDVVITGVRILVKTKDDSGASSETIQAFISGTEGYVIEISENPFITVDNAQEIVNWLGTQLNGFTFRKANVSHGSNPAIEAGDVAVVFDRKGAAFPIVVSKTTFSVGSSQTTISAAQTPTRNSAARYSVETKNYVEMRKRLKTEMTARQQAQADLAQRIASANGLYQTDVTTQGGGTKHYLHNKTNLNESDIQILVSDVGVTMTANGTDAQPTWYGLTVDGTLIANILSVSGINADWINAGQLVIKDANDNETFFADTQTGVVRINATSFYLGGSTIQSIANASVTSGLATLTQQDVFNRLTNNGAAQGMALVNGNLYINASYIRSGTLSLGGANNGNGTLEVYDSQNRRTGLWDAYALYVGNIATSTTDPLFKVDTSLGRVNILHLYVSNVYPKKIELNQTDSEFELVDQKRGSHIRLNASGFALSDGNYMDLTGREFRFQESNHAYAMGTQYAANGDFRILSRSTARRTVMDSDELYLSNANIDTASNYRRSGITYDGFYSEKSVSDVITELVKTSLSSMSVTIGGSVTVSGTKSREVSTPDYSERLMYCYETPSPLFGDVGEGVIGEDGKCYVSIDPVFAETVTLKQYQVFLQKYGAGECYVSERKGAYFVVEGTPNLAFGWELKAKQADFDQLRLERDTKHVSIENEQNYSEDGAEHFTEVANVDYAQQSAEHIEEVENIDYGQEAVNYIESLKGGRLVA